MALSSFQDQVGISPKGLETNGFSGEGNAIDRFGVLTYGFIWQITGIWTDVDSSVSTSWTNVDFSGTTTWTNVDSSVTTTWTYVDLPPDQQYLLV